MKGRQNPNSFDRSIVVHRVIPASAFRRLRGDSARQKKSKKALRRMKKEHGDE